MGRVSTAGIIAAAAGSVAAFVAGNSYVACLSALDGAWTANLPAAAAALPSYVMENGPVALGQMPLLAGAICAIAVWIAWSQITLASGNFRHGEEHGSARWLAPADAAKRFSDRKHPDNNIILTRHVGLAVDQSCLKRAYRRAKNILVVGGTGSGKTHMYVMPNALQANQDFFFTDTKGTLSKNLGQMFADRGYDVLVFSTKDPAASARYNTLAYLESPIDIIEWVRAFISITNGEEAKSEEAFWTNTTVLLLLTQVSYLVSYCPDEDRNLNGLITLLSLAQASEEDESFVSPYELLMREIAEGTMLVEKRSEQAEPRKGRRDFKRASSSSFEWRRVADPKAPEEDFTLLCWTLLKAAAGKTLKSVIISTNSRLQSMMVPEMRELTMFDEMGLDRFGEADRKRVVFAETSDTTDAFSFLMAMMVWQTIHVCTEKADRDYGGELPRPLHLMCDEFYNLGRLSQMDHVITTVRSRNISMSIMLQSVAQLEARYGEHEAQIIIDNCDVLLFLGGKSTKTNKMLSEMVGKETVDSETWNVTRGTTGSTTRNRNKLERDLIQASEAGKLPRDKAIVIFSGSDPVIDGKYPADAHPRWREAAGHEGSMHPEPFSYPRHKEGLGMEKIEAPSK